MLYPLALLSQAPQNVPFKTWSCSQKLLEIKLNIVKGETWKHMLVRGKHVLSIFSQFSLHPSLIHCNSQSGHQEEIFYIDSLGKVAPVSVSFSVWLSIQLQLLRSCCVAVRLLLGGGPCTSVRGDTDTWGSPKDSPTETLPSQSLSSAE